MLGSKELIWVNLKYRDEPVKTVKLSAGTTIDALKQFVFEHFGVLRVNYMLLSDDRDYTKFDKFSLNQLFVARKEIFFVVKLYADAKKEEEQPVVLGYEEGEPVILAFLVEAKKLIKLNPKYMITSVFPYNSRYIQLKEEKKLFFCGGSQFLEGAAFYDYDLDLIEELPNLPSERQRHSLVQLGECVYILGGDNSRKVDRFHLEFQDYEAMPDLNYARQDPATLLLNESVLIVAMGYSNETANVLLNLEKLDLTLPRFSAPWIVYGINNPFNLSAPRNLSSFVSSKEEVLLVGGMWNGTSQAKILCFDTEKYSFKRYLLELPMDCAFSSKHWVEIQTEKGPRLYNFCYGDKRIMAFEKGFFYEVIL